MAQTIVDTHPHIISSDTTRYPITPLAGKRSDWSAEHSITLEQLIAGMDEAGVGKAAIVHSSTTYGFNNDYVADAVALHPKRFTGVFSVHVLEPDAPEKMRYWHKKGCTGMRIYARGTTIAEPWLALDDPKAMPAWTCASDLGISVATNMLADPAGIAQFSNIMTKFPKVKLFLDHVGRPPTEDGPPYALASDFFRLSRFPNFYLKLTPSGLASTLKGKATSETFVKKLVAEFGANRIAWGSNYPASKGSMGDILGRLNTAIEPLSQSDRDWILGKTAQTLYPTLAD